MAMISCLKNGKEIKKEKEVFLEGGEDLNSLLLIKDIKLKRSCSCKNEIKPLIQEADKLYHRLFHTSYSMILPIIYWATCIIGIGIPFIIKYFMDRKRLSDLQSKVVHCLESVCPIISRSHITDRYEYIKSDVKFPVDPKDHGGHTLEYLVYSKALKKNADAIIIDYGDMTSKVSRSSHIKDWDNIYVSYVRVKD